MLVVLVIGLSACAQEATLVRETTTGGTAAFSFTKESETLSSQGRHDALALIDKKCPRGYSIVHEGAIPRVSQQVDRHWRGQISTVHDGGIEERLWGLQFKCN
ncbi:MAG: hypothetical protein HY281_11630 [Nitrospirae bacterium]|nr:hypothetical protein [Nitrospirota bacterium]